MSYTEPTIMPLADVRTLADEALMVLAVIERHHPLASSGMTYMRELRNRLDCVETEAGITDLVSRVFEFLCILTGKNPEEVAEIFRREQDKQVVREAIN